MKVSAITLIACASGLAHGAPVFLDGIGDDNALQFASGAKVEARFKSDTTNWDTRLEFDSFPDNGDTTGGVANGRSNFENKSFGFDLSFNATTSVLDWTITRDNGGVSTISQTLSGFDSLNTLQILTSGRAGSTSVSNLSFTGLGMDAGPGLFPNLDVSPDTSEFAETVLFFGNDFNILSGDWSLSGDIAFGEFNRSNPGERNKITIKALDGFLENEIPAPGALALLGLGALGSSRRRR